MKRPDHKLRYLYPLMILVANLAYGQGESENWIFGDGIFMKVKNDTFQVQLGSRIDVNEGTAVLSSKSGELELYSDGVTIWNGNHEVVPGGNSLNGTFPPKQLSSPRQSTILLRHSTENITMVSQGLQEGGMSVLEYHKLNGTAPYGIISANNLLHTNEIVSQGQANEGLASVEVKDCSSREYWLVTGKNDKPGRLYIYRATEDSVYFHREVSYGGNKAVRYLKFSPDVDKLVVIEGFLEEASERSVWLTDFDPQLGTITHTEQVFKDVGEVFLASAEFSTNSIFLYLALDKLYQYDVANRQIVASKEERPNDMLLAFEDKILMLNGSTLSVLDSINSAGIGDLEDVHLDGELGLRLRKGFPLFPASYFLFGLSSDAGEDRVVCAGDSIKLGGTSKGSNFLWTPQKHLDNPNSPNPTFTYSGILDRADTIIYTLESTEGVLNQCDTVRVIVHPLPINNIVGPKSICPGSKGVRYSYSPIDEYSYDWKIIGGEISHINDGWFEVDWFDENDSAALTLEVTSDLYSCGDQIINVPIQIKTKIEPEIPIGPDYICSDLRLDHSYFIPETPGSIYIWHVNGGLISSGQGSSLITVDWIDTSVHSISVEQTTTTEDTVCYGQSIPLQIQIANDSSKIELKLVTVDTVSASTIEVYWDLSSNGSFMDHTEIWRSQDTNNFEKIASLAPEVKSYFDTNVSPALRPYTYYLSQKSWCQNEIESERHNSIHLSSLNGTDEMSEIALHYNHYSAWFKAGYEVLVYNKTDSLSPYLLLESNSEYTSPFLLSGLRPSYNHYFRIGSKLNEDYISWSNSIQLKYLPRLDIPNVFTPNKDGINDFFVFPKLELFPENRLVVFNRDGILIYSKENYKGEWDGSEISDGVYFYQFIEQITHSSYKGWVQILR